jgi:hypothetical protein
MRYFSLFSWHPRGMQYAPASLSVGMHDPRNQ